MAYEETPLDADELMNFAERIEALPSADAEWVGALFQECLRARMREAELIASASGPRGAPDEEAAQLALDCADWLKTLWDVGYMGAGSFPAPPRSAFPVIQLEDVLKSALFARIREGKRPLPFPPPTRRGLPWHDLLETSATDHRVDAEIVRDEQGVPLGAIVEACADWRVVGEISPGREYLVQHHGKGPIFRLFIEAPQSRLEREPPAWTRTIRLQERGGFRSYTLDWPQDDGPVQAVPLRAATWERAESEAAHWIASHHPQMYGQVRFERISE
jgi:hypothetical protein